MRTLASHINEALKIGKNLSSFSTYSCQPKTKEELMSIIKERMKINGDDCDLNDIDVSQIDDMSYLFFESKFRGNISKWNVLNVEDMCAMFMYSKFNGDISKWDVSKVTRMTGMFSASMFNQDISRWNVSNVRNMIQMFYDSDFNQDISLWNISKDCETKFMFNGCKIKDEFKPVF